MDRAAAQAITLPGVTATPPSDVELRALAQTRHAIFLRTLFFATGLFCTLVPLAIHGDEHGVRFLILGRHPGIMWAFWSVAAASWTAWYVMNREVRTAGL